MENNLFKISTGFRRDELYHVEEYDAEGNYLGQWQPNADGDGEIFIGPDLVNPCCDKLTKEEMDKAR